MSPIRDIIVIGLVAISLPICFLRPFFGVLVWTVFAFLNPHEFAWGIARQLSLAEAVAIPTLAGALMFRPKWKQLLCREVILLAMLWVWFTITSLNAAHEPLFTSNTESTWLRWNLVSKILLMTVLIVLNVNTRERLRWLALTIAGSFGVLILKSLPAMILSNGEVRLYGPPNSMIADNNDLGLALNLTLPFFFFLAKSEKRVWLKRLLGFTFLAAIPAVMFTYSRGAFAGMVVVLLYMMLQSRQRLTLIPVAAFLAIVALLLAPQAWRSRISSLSADRLDASEQSRINAWTYSWRLANDYPLMGGGFDAFTPELFDRYAPSSKDVHGPHSIYFGVLAEHGFTGLFLYLLLVGSCFWSTHKTVKIAKITGDDQAILYARIFRVALVGFLVSGTFLGRAYFDFYFTLVASIAVLKQLVVTEPMEYVEEDEQESLEEFQPVFEAGGAQA